MALWGEHLVSFAEHKKLKNRKLGEKVVDGIALANMVFSKYIQVDWDEKY